MGIPHMLTKEDLYEAEHRLLRLSFKSCRELESSDIYYNRGVHDTVSALLAAMGADAEGTV